MTTSSKLYTSHSIDLPVIVDDSLPNNDEGVEPRSLGAKFKHNSPGQNRRARHLHNGRSLQDTQLIYKDIFPKPPESPLHVSMKKSSGMDISYLKDAEYSNVDIRFRDPLSPNSPLPQINSQHMRHLSSPLRNATSSPVNSTSSLTGSLLGNVGMNSNTIHSSPPISTSLIESDTTLQKRMTTPKLNTSLASNNSFKNNSHKNSPHVQTHTQPNPMNNTQMNKETVQKLQKSQKSQQPILNTNDTSTNSGMIENLFLRYRSSPQSQVLNSADSSIERALKENRIPAGRQQAIFAQQWFQNELNNLSLDLQNEINLFQTAETRVDTVGVGGKQLLEIFQTSQRFKHFKKVRKIIQHAMFEVIRQVGVNCVERGQLLGSIWVRTNDIMDRLMHLLENGIPSFHEVISCLKSENYSLSNKLEEQSTKYEEQLTERDTKIKTIETRMRDLEATLAEQKKHIALLEEHVETSRRKSLQKDKTIVELKSYCTNMQDQVRTLKDKLSSSIRDKESLELLKDDFQIVEQEKLQMQETINHLQNENDKLKKQEASLTDNVTNLLIENDTLKHRLEYLSTELEQKKDTTTSLQIQLRSLLSKQYTDKEIQVDAINESSYIFDVAQQVNKNSEPSTESIIVNASIMGNEIAFQSPMSNQTGKINQNNQVHSTLTDGTSSNSSIERKELLNTYTREPTKHSLSLRALEEIFRNIYSGKYKFDMKNEGKWIGYKKFIINHFTSQGINTEELLLQVENSISRFPNAFSTMLFDFLYNHEYKFTLQNGKHSPFEDTFSNDSRDRNSCEKESIPLDFIRSFTYHWGADIESNIEYIFSSPGDDHEQMYISNKIVEDVLERVFSFISIEDMNVMKTDLANFTKEFQISTLSHQESNSSAMVNVHQFFLDSFYKYWKIFIPEVWKGIGDSLQKLEKYQNITPDNSSQWDIFLGRYEHFKSLIPCSSEELTEMYTKYQSIIELNPYDFLDVFRLQCATCALYIPPSVLFQLGNTLEELVNRQQATRSKSSLLSGFFETRMIHNISSDGEAIDSLEQTTRSMDEDTNIASRSRNANHHIQRKLIRIPGKRSKPLVRFTDFSAQL